MPAYSSHLLLRQSSRVGQAPAEELAVLQREEAEWGNGDGSPGLETAALSDTVVVNLWVPTSMGIAY